jgi:hypothetical protein
MKKISALGCALLAAFTFFGCQKDQNLPTVSVQPQQDHRYYTPDLNLYAADRSTCDWIILPAGSTDALASAIAATCEGGVIYLKAGIHTENQAVIVNKSVKIMGEAGAILKLKSDLAPIDMMVGVQPIRPGLHVLNAPGTLIQDLEIQPLGADGGTAILLENAHQSAVIGCKILSFQFSVLVEKSDRAAIMRNTIVATSAWQTGAVSEAESIVIINGKSAYVSDNDVSNALFGIWPCDEWGTCERNTTHGNYIGIILCKVPQYLQLPDGRVTGAQLSATSWKTRQNNSHNNLDAGYLVIDGSNNNLLEDNDGGSNGTYDYELVGDSHRFGFLTPFVFNNTVYAKAGQTVKNCGVNNVVFGGMMVDTGVDACR